MIEAYILLGIVQGIFEWIPISSEGVVALLSQFLIKNLNPVNIALFLHLGTFFAVMLYFRKDWLEILMFKNLKLLRFLVIVTIVSLAIGYPFYRTVENIAVGNTLLIVMGFGLLLTAYFHKTKKTLNLNLNSLAIVSGLLQGLSVIPGLSRSGATIFGLSLGENNPYKVLKISYLMSAPVVLASSFYLFLENPVLVFKAWPALIFSFLVGILALDLLIKISKRVNFFKFALVFSFLCFTGAIIGFMIK